MDSSVEYSCVCGEKILFREEKILALHLRSCEKHCAESPVYEMFAKIPLATLEVSQLVALKLDYHSVSAQVAQELLGRGYLGESDSQEGAMRLQKALSMTVQSRSLSRGGTLPLLMKRQSSRGAEDKYDVTYLSKNMIKCLKCHKLFYDLDHDSLMSIQACGHEYCKACLGKYVHLEFLKCDGHLICLEESCKKSFSERDYVTLLGREKYDQMVQEGLEKRLNIVACAFCREKFEFIKGKPDPLMKDLLGKPISLTLSLHYAENRFVCPSVNCKKEQCKSCRSSPYHIGFNCSDFQLKAASKMCRYCDSRIDTPDKSRSLALQSICSGQECVEKMKSACSKILDCDHPCNGYINENECLSCLNDKCAEQNSEELLGQSGSDFCNICYIEPLSSAPCIQVISCGHVFHLSCMTKRLEMRWTRPRITFNFCLCPLCKTWMQFHSDSPLETRMIQFLAKFENIKKKSLERLKHEGREKDERLMNPSDAYFQKPLEYAIAIYSYYECFTCKNPYFGGLKRCEDLMEEGQNPRNFKPEELICANCCDVMPIEDCPRHGKDFIEFKCRLCCSIALWFCWGTTHFCEPCHERYDFVITAPIDQLPKCPGKDKCPLKVDHRRNGEECSLGCSLCRNIKEEYKDF